MLLLQFYQQVFLIDGICTIENLPNISDVKISCDILEKLGAKIT